jgi:hypothetical protein
MKEMKFEIPAGFDVEKVETTDGHVVIALKEKELPKSWEEFCEMYPINAKECYITFYSEIISFDPETEISERNNVRDRSVLPDRTTAEAVLALCQLIQLRNCYNGEWVPNWKDKNENKYVIEFYEEEIEKDVLIVSSQTPLFFKSEKIRDEFLCNFRSLIEKLRPLYGIKEGGEK